jgi:hypothetical protein
MCFACACAIASMHASSSARCSMASMWDGLIVLFEEIFVAKRKQPQQM